MSEKIEAALLSENDDELRQRLSELRQDIALAGTEISKAVKQLADYADRVEALTAKTKKQLDIQQKQITTLGSAIENWSKAQKSSADQMENLTECSDRSMNVFQKVQEKMGELEDASSRVNGFINTFTSLITALGGATSGVGSLSGMLMKAAGPAGAIVTGIIAVRQFSDALKEAREEAEREVYIGFAEGMSESMAEFENRVSSAKSVLDTLDIGAAFSPEKQQEITDGIEQSQNRIMEIAQLAAGQSRELTKAEQEEIEGLIGLIDSYVGQKLDTAQATSQTILALTERGHITIEESLKSAKEMYDQELQMAEESRNKKYQMAQKFDEKERQRLYEQADKEFEIEKAGIEKRYAEVSAANLTRLQEENQAGNQQLENLADLFDKMLLKEKEYHEIEEMYRSDYAATAEKYGENTAIVLEGFATEVFNIQAEIGQALVGLDKDFAAAYMDIAMEVTEKGGEITGEQERLALSLVQAFDCVPENLRAEAGEAMQALGMGFSENGELVYTAGASIGQRVMDGFNSTNLWNGMYRMAGDVAEGFSQGLRDRISEVEYEAGRLVAVVDKVTRQKLEIKSPSRVMKRLGAYTGQGFEEGLRESLHKVEGVSAMLAEAALVREETVNRRMAAIAPWINSPAPSLEAQAALYGKGGPFYAGDYSASGSIRRSAAPMANIIISLDGKTIGQAVAPVVSQEIQTQAVFAARGRGNSYI